MVEPGGIIGILGGGQLGRMTALAAANLGYRCHIFCPEPDSPAMQVTPLATVAAYEDAVALARFADAVDVVTFEFENVPAQGKGFSQCHWRGDNALSPRRERIGPDDGDRRDRWPRDSKNRALGL
jgi:phosphoribosylaminoimidazole carboxylase (NCAIR synthetase)